MTTDTLQRTLSQKLGPLPVWVWAGGAFIAATLIRSRFSSSSAKPASDTVTPGGETVDSAALRGQNVSVEESSAQPIEGSGSQNGAQPGLGSITVPLGSGLVAFDPVTLRFYEFQPESGAWVRISDPAFSTGGSINPAPVDSGDAGGFLPTDPTPTLTADSAAEASISSAPLTPPPERRDLVPAEVAPNPGVTLRVRYGVL